LTPITPANEPTKIVNEQPSFAWTALLTPTAQPRVAASLYRLQLDEDPNFGSPVVFTTEATAFTLPEGKGIVDGTWYWRVAVVDSSNNVGTYSAPQQFYKEYLAPAMLHPAPDTLLSAITSFEWAAVPGAAYYQIDIDDDPLFNSPLRDETDNTRYTPTQSLPQREYYWRVRIYDKNRKPGPFVTGRIQIQAASLDKAVYLPIVQR